MNADGSGVRRLTDNPAVDSDANWSPDGDRLAFASDRSGDFEIYTMTADGRNVKNVTQSPSFEADPAWSPSGSMITFTSNRNGSNQVS